MTRLASIPLTGYGNPGPFARARATDSIARLDWVAYLLAVCAAFGLAGLHRFYLNRPLMGLVYLATWGLFGFGTLYDLLRMRELVSEANARPDDETAELAKVSQRASARVRALDRELAILQCAQARGGTITAELAALEARISLDDAQKDLNRLRASGFCSLDVSEDGAETFTFPGAGSPQPPSL